MDMILISTYFSYFPVNTEDQSCYQKVAKRPQLYLLLENLVSKYKHPCVLDLKVGTRQYADDVSAAKKARKIAKAANTTLGIITNLIRNILKQKFPQLFIFCIKKSVLS